MSLLRRLGALCLLGLLAACTPAVPAVQRLETYTPLLGKPLEQRLQPADARVLDRAHRTNLDYGDDVRPRAADPEHPLLPTVRAVLAGLPPLVKQVAERHLAAVYVVEGDVGSATTEGVQDYAGAWRYAYIVLNLTALQRDANAWATWKEHSAFRDSPGYELRLSIEPQTGDDRAGAVRFILLHELGHVLGLGLAVHGYWDDVNPLPRGATRLSPFAALSWELRREGDALKLRSRYVEREPALRGIGFYKFEKAPHALADAEGLYGALERTDFPSLYGTLNVYDDWAESFAIYVHTILLQRPYRVELLRDGEVLRSYRSCIATGACADKAAQVKALLESAVQPPAPPAASGSTGVQMRFGVGAGISIRR